MSDTKTILEKLEKLDARIDNIDVTLAKQQVSLDYHIKRSDQADHAIKIISERMEPIEQHTDRVNFTTKVLAALGAIITFAVGIYKSLF